MPSKIDITVIIVTHNASSFLRETLASLYTQRGVSFETIVVDNLSSDNTLIMLSKYYPQVKVLKRDTHIGFAAANNLGVQHAHAETILFLNPDITFNTTADLAICFARLHQSKTIGALTPRVNLLATGQIDVTCHRGFPTPWASFTHFSGLARFFPSRPEFNHYTKSYLGYDNEHPIDSIGGMFMLVPRSAGEAIGWWDETYNFYGEDLDFCYRLWSSNYTVIYYPKVLVMHHKGATTGMSKASRDKSTASVATTRQVKIWSIQAMEIFYNKHYRSQYPFFINWLVYLGIKLLYLIRVGII